MRAFPKPKARTYRLLDDDGIIVFWQNIGRAYYIFQVRKPYFGNSEWNLETCIDLPQINETKAKKLIGQEFFSKLPLVYDKNHPIFQ